MPPEVVSPQPQRPLKRKLLDDHNHDGPPTKTRRTHLDLSPSPTTKTRCRSDSFLLRSMSPDSDTSRPRTDRRSPRRYDEEPPQRRASVPAEFHQARQISSSAALSSPDDPSASPISCPGGGSTLATTPSISFTDDSRPSSRVKAPSYRDDLLRNNIHIEPLKREVPASVIDYGHQIITRKRDSPGLQESQVQNAIDTIYSLRNEDEDTIRSGYISTQLLPGPVPYQGMVKMGSNIPSDSTSLPPVPLAPPLSIPRPDQHYCLDRMSFTVEEDNKQSHSALRRYSKPSTAGCWPYFTVELKSEAGGGTFWVAENQNAGNGALCVNAMEKLHSLAKAKYTEIESISFSCNINAKNAEIWIHYCQNQRFFSAEFRSCRMRQDEDVVCFRNSIKNIVEFGFTDRLPQIKALLAKISLPDLDSVERIQRVRKADEDGSIQSFKRSLDGA